MHYVINCSNVYDPIMGLKSMSIRLDENIEFLGSKLGRVDEQMIVPKNLLMK